MSDYHDQLAAFDEKIVKHPQLASSYATNGFLSALVHLNQESVSDNVTLLKNVVRAFTIVLPPVFLTICKNETETQMWANTEELLQALRHSWIHHANTGVRIYAFKCLQLLVSLESKRERKTEDPKDVFYLNLVRPGHRLLNVPELEKEGISHLDVLLDRLSDNNENNTVITAIINCLTQLVKRRPQFTRAVIGALVAWCKSKPGHMTATDLKNVEKSIKLAFVAMIRTSRLSAYRTELTGAYTAIGGNPSALQSRSSRSNPDRHDETRRKRAPESSSSDRSDKKARTYGSQSTHATHHHQQHQHQHQQQFPIRSMNSGVDVTSLPLNVAANLCMAILQNVSMDTLNERFRMASEFMHYLYPDD
ncbi:hypothetical protein [Absidia glauca]|uniref:Symplekin/Pta1 N-terminal domain-containing protein n=1 Tax=Absidia glauca TaxID=4829 RepID=A0A168LV93_ABSGL|nr:hypothetical protein [Absidia glauca]